MSQLLIVEGNDAVPLAALCEKSGLKAPKGYPKTKFVKEFVKSAGGYDNALKALADALTQHNLTNIGIIVDANDLGPPARWQSIRNILSVHFSESSLKVADQQVGSKIISQVGMPKVGVWIMPDNVRLGYLEHFLSSLIPTGDVLLSHAQSVVHNLPQKRFSVVKTQKVLLHTWLAWQPDPGYPFGTAINIGYFDIQAPDVPPFLDWFSQTFELSN